MELSESIGSAWAAVEKSGVPEHMQELAFREALRAVLTPAAPPSSTLRTTPAAVTEAAQTVVSQPSTSLDQETLVDEAAVNAAVSDHTGVPVERLERVFHIDGGVVKLSVNHNALGRSVADKTRTAAQIITVVRKIGMGQAETEFDLIRDECQRKHFYDSKNFASKHLPEIDGFVVKGEGRSRRLEARHAGISAFPDLIDKVLGAS